MERPQKIDITPLTIQKLVDQCEKYIDYLAEKDPYEEGDTDLENKIFEEAMETVYGPDVWKWINTRIL